MAEARTGSASATTIGSATDDTATAVMTAAVDATWGTPVANVENIPGSSTAAPRTPPTLRVRSSPMLRKARTTIGSNCVPELRTSSSRAASAERGFL